MQLEVGQTLDLNARVWLNGVDEASVAAEIVLGSLDDEQRLRDLQVAPMSRTQEHGGPIAFVGQFVPADSGQLSFGVRVRPDSPDLINPHELGLSKWAQ